MNCLTVTFNQTGVSVESKSASEKGIPKLETPHCDPPWPPLSSFGKSTPPHAAHHIICQWPNDFLVIFILKQIAACTWKYVCVFVFVCLNANVCLCACLCVRACVCLRVRGTQSPNKAGIIGARHSPLYSSVYVCIVYCVCVH